MIKGPFDTISFKEISKTINEACDWLSSHGFDFPKTRIGEYKKHLAELSDYFEKNEIEELLKKREYSTLVNSCFEANEFYNIYTGLKDYTDSSLVKRLADFIKGPNHYRDEKLSSSSNRARNIGFELLLSAKFLSNGFEVDLSEDCDLIVKAKGVDIYLECKRPQKEHQIHSNIKGALSQLVKRYSAAESPENCRGILAISIGKVFNPEQFLLLADSPKELAEKLSTINKGFLDYHYKSFQNQVSTNTIGIISHLGIPAEISGLNLLTNCNEYGLMQIGTDEKNTELLTEIGNELKCKP